MRPEDDCPKCDKCGAPITTGLMAVFCPKAEQCEFWVPEQADFLRELRGEAIEARGKE